MKTKYKHVTFKKDMDWPFWYGGPKRLNKLNDKVIFIRQMDGVWQSQHNHLLTAAEHRDIADFLNQLNREGRV